MEKVLIKYFRKEFYVVYLQENIRVSGHFYSAFIR